MRYRAAAFDYDGTLAHVGRMDPATIESLQRLLDSGRKLVLISGRTLDDLKNTVAAYSLFDEVVAENGAVLRGSDDERGQLLTQPADRLLVEELAERGVQPLAVGRCIIATYVDHTATMSAVIHELDLDYSIIFNKEHAMALPTGVNKASGLRAALHGLNLLPESSVVFGDAENDEVMFAAAGFGVAVHNAVPSLKVIADFVTEKEHGFGVVEAIDHLLANEFVGVSRNGAANGS